MSRLSPLLLLASLAATACSFSYPLDVGFIGGKVAFSAKKQSSGCLGYLEVTSETGELMWKFEGPYVAGNCRSNLPLIYGHVPSGSTKSIPAKPLHPNVKYFVAASDGDSYYGSFRIRRMFVADSDAEERLNGPYFKGDLANATEPAGDVR